MLLKLQLNRFNVSFHCRMLCDQWCVCLYLSLLCVALQQSSAIWLVCGNVVYPNHVQVWTLSLCPDQQYSWWLDVIVAFWSDTSYHLCSSNMMCIMHVCLLCDKAIGWAAQRKSLFESRFVPTTILVWTGLAKTVFPPTSSPIPL